MPIAPPLTMSLFEEWAEDSFQSAGSGTGVTINPARRDKRGWDFIAEWDEKADPHVPRDRQVVARTARIQVKSTRQTTPTVRLKLSNAMRFVEANVPCFVVLYWYDKKARAVEVFARHFDAELIEATLKRAREADRDGRDDHHNIRLQFTLDAGDMHTDELVTWIQSQCAQAPSEYSGWKEGVRSTVGGRGLVGTIKIPVAEKTSFIEHAVGLRDFNPDWIEFRETRFGIPSSTVERMDDDATYRVQVKPRSSAMHFETEAGERASFRGVTRSMEIPGYPDVELIAAFHSDHIVTRIFSSLRMESSYSLNGSDDDEIRDLRNILQLFCWFGEEQLYVVFELEGRRLERGIVADAPRAEERDMFLWALDRIDALLSCSRASEHPWLCVADLIDNSDLLDDFYSCIAADRTTLKMQPKNEHSNLPEPIEMVGYCYVEVANTIYVAFYHQTVLTKRVVGEETIIEFGKPTIVDRWAKSGSAVQLLPKIKRRFKALLSKRPSGTIYFNEGDMLSALHGAQEIGMRAAVPEP